MNVACTACPAKYAVPDERVRGKRVRITCKHCGTFIVVDGTTLGASSGSQVGPLPQSAAANAARERRKTMLGIGGAANPNANAAASLGVPVQSSPRASRAPQADVPAHHAWLVALSDGRREPASLARIVDLFAAGSIDASTYIWRDGMADWKRPFEISEIAAALRARGIGPDGAKGQSLPPPDPEEATRVSFAPSEEALAQRASSAPPRTPTSAPGTSTRFDDESVTVARSGPPSNPFGYGKPAASPSGAPPGQKRPTLPPLNPAAGRPALPRPPTESAGRPRQNTMPPLGPPGGRPLAKTSTSHSVSGAMLMPSAPPPPPPPPPPVIAPSAPPPVAMPSPPPVIAAAPAPSMPDASAFVAAAAPHLSAPYAAPAQFPAMDVVPRSGPPVALQLDDDPFHRKRGKATTIVVSLIIVAAAAAAGFIYLQPRSAPPPAPVAAVPTPTPPPAPAPAPTPTATETSEPAASASAAPAPVAASEKTPAKTSSAARAKRDESGAPKTSARKAASAEASDGESSSDSSSDAAPSDTSTAERLARASEETTPPTPKGNANDPEFNRDAAAQGLGDAASRADSCRSIGGPSGSGQATVTFAPNGHVSAASVGGEFAGTTVGACIARLFRNVTVPAFSGESVTVSKRFTIE